MSLKRISIYLIALISLVLMSVFGTGMALASVPASQATLVAPPILLIVNSSAANRFGLYLGEILRAEGLNAFDQVELSTLTAVQLAQYDVAVLAQTPLTSAQASMFNTYVSGGGALLAMRPDSQIANLFGLSGSAGTLNNGYLQIQNAAMFNGAASGSGLTSSTLQIHGDADQYALASGAVMLARLYSNAATSTPYPAVVAANTGTGQAVAFTYDLASNVVYTRQGNPANANMDVDGDYWVRTTDLFETIGGGAPWIDRDKIPVPQADEQQRLFARLVQQLVGRMRPLPQLWYFPESAKTMLILTSDAHWNDASIDYAQFFADLNAHQGQASMYLAAEASTSWPSNAALQTWQAQGNTFGIHPYIGSGGDNSALTAGFNGVDSLFSSMYTIPRSNTVRTHRYLWTGWTSAAETAAAHNIALDVSFAPWGAWFRKADGTWPHGYMTGSGLPMKFIRTDGTLTSVYQQLTNLTDDQLFNEEGGFEGLTGSQAVAVSSGLIDASLAGNYSALTQLHHVDYYASRSFLQTWLTGVVDYARSKGVPVWNADRWLSFTQTRHDANYTNINWDGGSGVLSFNIAMAATSGVTPTTMLPLSYGGGPLQSVTVDGGAYSYSVQTIKSVNVAFVSIPAGNHSVSATYSVVPTTPTNTPTPTPTGTLGPTSTNTPTAIPTNTPTNTATPTPTPLPAGTCPCSIWSLTTTPAQAAVSDGRPIEIGVKFRSDVAGYITGLRFYKGTANTGTHVGNLWSSTGALLATATFANETASGWQEVAFSSPVAVQANTTYIASYFSNSGYFAINIGYFLTGVANAPLQALASGVDGPNGVYQYDTSGFPTNGTNNNYWVDVVFTTSASPSPTPTATPGLTTTPTNTPMPTDTPTPTATNTPTPTPTNTPTSTLTATPTNTPTPAPVPVNTGLLSPSLNAAATVGAGDNNGYEVGPTNAYANDGLFAVDNNSGTNTSTSCTNSGKDKHLYYGFGVNLPVGVAVRGIEVRLDGKADSTSGAPKFCVQLSWNGGTTWTAAKSTVTLSTTEQTFILGSPTDRWGRTWALGDFSNTNLRMRVIDVSSSAARDFSLDWVAVRVTY
jgi:hypothetical protein